ncbi:MAG TPA: glutamine amidotransferase [Phycisphaerae bacterium]|nr:glutamine amidotransferase [Phycisphaerae bacterium]
MTVPLVFPRALLAAAAPANSAATAPANMPWTLVWGDPHWLLPAALFGLLFAALLIFGYRRAGASPAVRAAAALCKAAGLTILLLCLAEPLISSRRARPGANAFVVLADNSQSMTLRDSTGKTRADALKSFAGRPAPWLAKIGRDFELRDFSFDTQLTPVEAFDDLHFDGASTNLADALDRIARQYNSRPLAGILLMTDGNATDRAAVDALLAKNAASPNAPPLPPIYPVLVGSDKSAPDIAISNLAVSQTNFEDAPVTITADITATGYAGKPLVAELRGPDGKSVETQKLVAEKDGLPLAVRFRLRPDADLSFYTIRVAADAPGAGLDQLDHPSTSDKTAEATLANNARTVAVNRPRGPYRVLYVSGRPNWEYKFLQRALASDDQLQLTALIRVAKREPKFAFLGKPGEKSNPLFQAFGNDPDDTQYDQPVLIRMNTRDETELKAGFPSTAEELFQYHAVIIDDLESEFFTQDQLALLKEFVRTRGGGLLMLGGEEAFHNGHYDRTVLGDVLPVYSDQVSPALPDSTFKLDLTRDGWLEPWVRLAPDEAAERQRRAQMPEFESINPIRGIKPGATVLARAVNDAGDSVPALVEQRFGRGRTAALLVGDLWRWDMTRTDTAQSDLDKSWRQAVRWLVSDDPTQLDLAIDDSPPAAGSDEPAADTAGTGGHAVHLAVQVRDKSYAPLDNATVTVKIIGPAGLSDAVELRAEPNAKHAGRYDVTFIPRTPGAYRATATALGPDGNPVTQTPAVIGWSSDPAADEFQNLAPNTALLDRLAHATGGEVVPAADINAFADSLPNRKAQITEPYVEPLWHHSWVFLLALAFLAAEWGIRRFRGLP